MPLPKVRAKSCCVYEHVVYARNCSFADKNKTGPYSRQHQSRAGRQGKYGAWAGALGQICSPFSSKRTKTIHDSMRRGRSSDVVWISFQMDGLTDGWTDQPTNQPMDGPIEGPTNRMTY